MNNRLSSEVLVWEKIYFDISLYCTFCHRHPVFDHYKIVRIGQIQYFTIVTPPKIGLLRTRSGSKMFFLRGPNNFPPSDIVVQGHFQVVSVILVPSKSNLCTFLIAVSSLRGAMAPSGLLLRSATGNTVLQCTVWVKYILMTVSFDQK